MKDKLYWMLHQWQEILRLQDWLIELKLLPRAEFDLVVKTKEPAWGHNNFYRYTHSSHITICTDSPDIEGTLVHELVHLMVDTLDVVLCQAITMAPGEPAQQLLEGSQLVGLERTVEHITQALLKTRRYAYEQGCNSNYSNQQQ